MKNVTPTMERPLTENEKQMAVADRYFEAWPGERASLLVRHRAIGKQLPELLGLPDVDAVRAIRTNAEVDALYADADDERKAVLEQAFRWIMLERGNFGGPLGSALSDPLPCPIAIETEYDELLTETPEQLRTRPPVSVTLTHATSTHCAFVLTPAGNYIIEPEKFAADDAASGSFAALVAELTNGDVESPAVRRLYYTFARDFWNWYKDGGGEKDVVEELSQPLPQRKYHTESQFADQDSLVTPSAKPIHVLFRALSRPEKWEHPPEDFPFYREDGLMVSLKGEPLRRGIDAGGLAQLKPVFDNIVHAPTVILYAACMDLWLRARESGRGLTSGMAVRIHVNDLCELFKKPKYKRGGYHLEHKLEFSALLQDLDELMGSGRYVDEKGNRRVLRGSYADVTFDDMEDLFENSLPYEYLVKPGDAVWDIITNNPQLMNVYTSLAPLIAGGGVKENAGKIGVYLCRLFRFRQVTQSYRDPISIKTILENSCIVSDATAVPNKHRGRFRDSIDKSFDLLVGKVIAGWQYVENHEEGLPDYGWFKEWLKNQVTFEPLPDVVEQGRKRLEAQTRHVKEARKASRRGRPRRAEPDR